MTDDPASPDELWISLVPQIIAVAEQEPATLHVVIDLGHDRVVGKLRDIESKLRSLGNVDATRLADSIRVALGTPRENRATALSLTAKPMWDMLLREFGLSPPAAVKDTVLIAVLGETPVVFGHSLPELRQLNLTASKFKAN